MKKWATIAAGAKVDGRLARPRDQLTTSTTARWRLLLTGQSSMTPDPGWAGLGGTQCVHWCVCCEWTATFIYSTLILFVFYSWNLLLRLSWVDGKRVGGQRPQRNGHKGMIQNGLMVARVTTVTGCSSWNKHLRSKYC